MGLQTHLTMMNQHQPHKRQTGRKANGDAKEKPTKHKTTYWSDVALFLNYIFAEHWLGLLIGGSALGCIFLALSAISIKPIWWGCIGTMLLADLLIFAIFYVFNARMTSLEIRPTPPTSQAARRLDDLHGSIIRLHAINASDAAKEDQLRRLQLQVMEAYFFAVDSGELPALEPPIRTNDGPATLQDWKALVERMAGPLLSHPGVIGSGKDGEAYRDPPIGITAWIDHAAAVVHELREQMA